MKRKINIVNFIRAVEPRSPQADLFAPVAGHMKLVKQYDLPVSWLLQYDALISRNYVEFLKEQMPESHETGLWFEIVQPLVEKAGLIWHGRYPWDWHVNTGFSVGYTPLERERLIDIAMEEFKRQFGKYPASVGSWFIDAHSLGYLADQYKIVSSCNCKDQIGTDGYTLWGGYWANGYYPSRDNMYMPAQTLDKQIDVPVFRMLGSDPIYQYDAEISSKIGQAVITLEMISPPVNGYVTGGRSEEWVQWFLNGIAESPCLSMSYAQAGQENSFGWPAMEKYAAMQYPVIAAMRDNGKIEIETLSATGRWFREHFPQTPPTSVVCLEDVRGEGRETVWYLSRFQRLSFLTEDGHLFIRDWHLFDENYREEFLDIPCHTIKCTYDTLPVINRDRVCLWYNGTLITGTIQEVAERNDILEITWHDGNGTSIFSCHPDKLEIEFVNNEYSLYFPGKLNIGSEKKIQFSHNNFSYLVRLVEGQIDETKQRISPCNRRILFMTKRIN